MPDGQQQGGGTPPSGTGQQGGKPGGSQGGQQPATQTGSTQQGGETPTYETWLAKQDEATKTLLDGHTKGLKSALDNERQQRGELAKQLKDLSGKTEKGSELEKALADATGKLEAAERRAAFIEDAAKPEIGCTNPKAAYLVAMADELFDRRGNPDWPAIKAAAPELFRKQGGGSADGGAGGSNKPSATGMNDWIRRAAGR